MDNKIELIITRELIEDCLSYGNINAGAELKVMVMEELEQQFEKIVIDNTPKHLQEEVQKEFNSVKIYVNG